MPDYSIVIPAFDEELLLPSTIAALREAMNDISLEGEIIVVDNNSSDATAEVASKAGARVVFEPVNRISTARNAGAKVARGEWFVFVDADTRIPVDLLKKALNSLAGGKIGGGGACIRFGPDGKGAHPLMLRLWNWISRFFKLAAGSFIFCLREGFEEVGGFSNKVYAGEEILFSRQYKRWCLRQGLGFQVFPNPPVSTSARKLQWYSPFRLAATFCLFVLCPFLVRSRSFCSFWYDRPKVARDSGRG
ncbi:MAG: glycosyl transferase family 2 [Opitutae bacterium]|nr:glycosyl transferase family 2 [Opitutae bacterium]|tara:strand:- start:383 stop:1126 length:744 start_codon:yes stop_codon:yes gene_type:complete